MLNLEGALFDEHPAIIEIVSKSEIFLKMATLYKKTRPHVVIGKRSPRGRAVVVTRPYKIGDLVLVMAYPKVSSLEEWEVPPYDSYVVKGHGKKVKMWVSPYINPKLIIPTWWCATTTDKSASNTSLEWRDNGGMQFSCIVNTVALNKGDAVVRYLAAKEGAKQEKQPERKLILPSIAASPMGSMGPPAPVSKKRKARE